MLLVWEESAGVLRRCLCGGLSSPTGRWRAQVELRDAGPCKGTLKYPDVTPDCDGEYDVSSPSRPCCLTAPPLFSPLHLLSVLPLIYSPHGL